MSNKITGNVFRTVGILIIALFVVQTVAFADTVNVDGDSNTVAVDGSVTVSPGGSGTASAWLVVDDNAIDPVGGCNASRTNLVTIAFSAVPAVVTFAPISGQVTGCSTVNVVSTDYTVGANAIAGSSIIVTAVASGGRTVSGNIGSFTAGQFTINVPGSTDSTPPVITPTVTGTLGNNGWYTSDVTVTWTVVDDESTITSKSAACDQITTINHDTSEEIVTCEATSAGGTSSESVTIKRDATAPDVSVTGVEATAYILGSAPEAGCDTTDATSGVATDATLEVTGGNANGVGNFMATCSGAADNAGNVADDKSVTYYVHYDFDGLFGPLAKKATARAGSAIPVQFSLNGDQGLDIFTVGFPKSKIVACETGVAAEDAADVAAVNPGSSSISYDAETDTYNYVWKTEKNWAGTCRQFDLKFNDGTTHSVIVEFKR